MSDNENNTEHSLNNNKSEKMKQYYLKNREKRLAYQKEYTEKHKEEIKEKRNQNKEKINNRIKEYNKMRRLELAKREYIEKNGSLEGFEGVKRGRPRKY